MKHAHALLIGLLVAVLMAAAVPLASAQASHVRWDIASVPCTDPGGSFPCTLNPGGTATAMATDCSIPGMPFGCTTISMTGSGTFVVPANGGSSNGVSGGGTWTVTAADGSITSGTYKVTELVQWQETEPLEVSGCVPAGCLTTDNIGNLSQATGGVAILRVAYSDGSTGVVTFACAGLPDPFSIAEGITATKILNIDNFAASGINIPPLPPGFPITKLPLPVLFWNAGVFTSFVEFHVQN
ncbi:MAG TPA: hypothetical protein VNX70_13485 [Bryobacteraceae bacterium]|nr:hypothetical protein [Bryobacteraceae bacterium]